MSLTSKTVLGKDYQIAIDSLDNLKKRFKEKFREDPEVNKKLFLEMLAYRIHSLEKDLDNKKFDFIGSQLREANLISMLGGLKSEIIAKETEYQL